MPAMTAEVEQRMKRWQEQRWILDTVIQTVGIEWDQRRIAYTLGPCGPEATGDFNGVRNRIKKFNDASREFRRAAIKREGIARRMEEQGSTVSAREASLMRFKTAATLSLDTLKGFGPRRVGQLRWTTGPPVLSPMVLDPETCPG